MDGRARRTNRQNAGIPGTRYGNPVYYTGRRSRREETEEKDRRESSPHHSERSNGSLRSVTSELKQKLVDDKANEEIDKLEEEFDLTEKSLKIIELDAAKLKKQIETATTKLEKDALNDLEKAELAQQLARWEKELEETESDIATGKVNVEYERKTLERKKQAVLRKAETDKIQIFEDEVPPDELENKSDVDKKEAIATWALAVTNAQDENEMEFHRLEHERQALNCKQQSSKVKQEDGRRYVRYARGQRDSISDADDDLMERLRNLQGFNSATVNRDPEQQCNRDYEVTNQSSMGKLAEAIVQAVSTSNASSSNDTKTFLARQVQGKDLPNFTGRAEEWPMFISAYENTTLQCQYSQAENLSRLQKCLKGEALQSVQCLLMEPSSVPKVISQLKMRYGRPEHIIESMMMKVRESPAVKMDKLETYIEFGIAVSNLTSMIESLGNKEQLMNPLLLNELVKKLPAADQRMWISWLTSDSTRVKSIGSFAEWIQIQTDLACQLCPPVSKVDDPKPDKQRKNRNSSGQVWSASEKKSSSSTGEEKKCQYCGRSNHRIRECRTFAKLDPDERWKTSKSKRLCFSCLNQGHPFKDCRSRRKCGVDNCEKYHHRLLHNNHSKPVPKEDTDEKNEEPKDEATGSVGCAMKTDNGRTVINLQMLPRRIRGPKGVIEIMVIIDPGADVTVCEESSVKKLGVNGFKKSFTVKGFQATTTNPNSMVVQDLEIQTQDGKWVKLKDVKTVDRLDIRSQSVKKSLISKWKHLKGLPIEPYQDKKPTLLIGSDHAALIAPIESRIGPGNAPVAVRTKLGWVLNGRLGKVSSHQYGNVFHMSCYDSLHQLVKDSFTTESIGLKMMSEKPRSREDKRAQDILDSTLKKVGPGWEVGLLWKSDVVKLPESKKQAYNRLLQMERRMDREPDFEKQYSDKFQEYLDKGFARVLTPEEVSVESDKTYYLSHFMARNPKKPKKLRFVFDAAARTNGSSLNDHLLQGPDKLPSLPGMLLRFRQRAVAITADIQDMFHRVRVRKEDVEAQRFLWRGKDRNREPDVLQMEVLIFGATCSPACAQEAKNRNALEYQQEFPEAYKAITTRHYVDDYLESRDTVEEAKKICREVLDIQSRGGFHLRNWMSNSRELLMDIPEEIRAKSMSSMAIGETMECERILGLFWRPDLDLFTFSLTYLKVSLSLMEGDKIPTKRELFSLTMSIYDPLGFVATLTVKARMILQATWRSEVDWNEEIPPSTHAAWKEWLRELSSITSFELPRCYSMNFSSATRIQLHLFCDASEEAYGAVAYFRIEKDREVHISLVMSKTKVAPLKALSIPRLELQAAVVGARLAKYIHDEIEIKIHETVYWTDSRTVACWIRNDSKRYQQYVAVRIGEVQELTEVGQWRWIPTQENVADEVTRMNLPCNWMPNSRWLNGPAFLLEPEERWPKEKVHQDIISENQEGLEMKKGQIFITMETETLIDVSRFSRYRKLIITTAYVRRFVLNIAHRQKRGKERAISIEEQAEAEQWWWRRVQQDCFAEELHRLERNLPIPKSSKLSKLSAKLDEVGILRVFGRLENAEIPVETKRPVILDPSHPYTKLLVRHFHEQCDHHGRERIVNEIRQRFHIFHVRALVKRTQGECQLCKNSRAQPAVPEMGQLPGHRLEANVHPFNKTGLDYFGPVEVIVKRSREKRYVALFTCLSVRAIHLEVVGSLSTDSCIMAIRRFISRRGSPAEIHSDNGTNFHGAANELKAALEQLDQDMMQSECSKRGIKWTFIPPAAPHMGGSWERMVQSVKVALGSTLQLKTLTEEVLRTLITEAEHTVNSHPLTHVPDDPNDSESLTPNHFLIGRSSNLQPAGKFTDELMGRKQWRVVQQLANHFWKRWVQEYLPTLLRRQKWCQPAKPIEVNDVVLEVNPNLVRSSWPKGIVTKCYPGKDGISRVVDIRMANGNIYRRPVSKLCVLDVKDSVQHNTTLDN